MIVWVLMSQLVLSINNWPSQLLQGPNLWLGSLIKILEARAPGIDHAPESGSVVVRNWLKQSHHLWTVDVQCNCCCCRVHAEHYTALQSWQADTDSTVCCWTDILLARNLNCCNNTVEWILAEASILSWDWGPDHQRWSLRAQPGVVLGWV